LNICIAPSVRVLLIQVRDYDDPMKTQEIECIRQCIGIESTQIEVFDLTACLPIPMAVLSTANVVVIGGSGNYSVAAGGPWWESAVRTLQLLHECDKPTFGSCWGFQALARAFGGRVVTDASRAEVGTIQVSLSDYAGDDPVFGTAPPSFAAQAGHQDIVEELPSEAICLAFNDRVQNQAMKFEGKPIYGTQFHPELNRQGLLERINAYPQYVEEIAGMPLADFVQHCEETPESGDLLRRFVAHYTS